MVESEFKDSKESLGYPIRLQSLDLLHGAVPPRLIQARDSLDMLQHRLDEAAVDARRHLNKRRWRLLAIVLVVIVCVAVIVAGSMAALLGRVKATAGHEAQDDQQGSPDLPTLCTVGEEDSAPKAGLYDLYVLSVSWGPHYCSTPTGQRDKEHCTTNETRRESAASSFVLQGLWPEDSDGKWPECCRTQQGLSSNMIDSMMDVMPSAFSVTTDWYRHGSCTGLSAQEYFAQARTAYKSFAIPLDLQAPHTYITTTPERLTNDIHDANPHFPPKSIVVHCQGENLNELNVCMSKTLEPRPCTDATLARVCPYMHVTIIPHGSARAARP